MSELSLLIRAETIKLRRSLALLLCLVAPACVSGFAALALATSRAGKSWDRHLDEGLAMWSFFMLPMAITALTILIAQVEHGPRMWNHLLVLPVRRAALLLAKAVTAFGLMLLMQVLVYAGLYAAGATIITLLPEHRPAGDMQLAGMAIGLSAMAVGAVPMLLLQLWAALRFRSFVPPLAIGIFGTFAALVITASGSNLYLPWLLPVYATMWPKQAGLWGVGLGVAGGAAALLGMLADLGRKEPL